jgi:type IV pilus assembly protein PilQ
MHTTRETHMQMTHRYRLFGIALAAGVMGFAGCTTPDRTPPDLKLEKPEPARAVREADALFQKGLYTEAIIQCIEIARVDPMTPGLTDLQGRISARMAEERYRGIATRDKGSAENAAVDATRHGILPDTYNLRRHVLGETAPLRTAPNAMQLALRKPVSIDLPNVGIAEIIAQIGASENINIVADGTAGAGKTLTIRAENTPLDEVLEFVGRNLDVTFSVGQNLIWVTPRSPNDSAIPLETRVYRLRKGLSGAEIENAPDGIGIIDAVTRFVPQETGADIFFSDKAHALLVKNTRENLDRTEDIIAALDVKPVQVLIEARFMSTSIADMRELGINWILNQNLVLAENGGVVKKQILADSSIKGMPAAPDTKDLGMNLTYQGLLNNSQFQAVLHALQKSGKTRTLTVPRVTTVNNKEAKIRIGKDFRYFEEFTRDDRTVYNDGVASTVSSLAPTGTPKLEELGYELKVTPSVGADLASIDLKLAPQISAFESWVSYDLGDSGSGGSSTNANSSLKLPIFSRSEIETELVVRSGETVIMGGLAQTMRSKTRSGVPFFSSLPWIGYLFGSDLADDTIDNLIIFVTATIISDEGEAMIPLNAREQLGLEVPIGDLREAPAAAAAPATPPGTTPPAAAPVEATPVLLPAAAPAPEAAAPAVANPQPGA